MKTDYTLKYFFRIEKNYAVKFPKYLLITKPHPCSLGSNRCQMRTLNTKLLHVDCYHTDNFQTVRRKKNLVNNPDVRIPSLPKMDSARFLIPKLQVIWNYLIRLGTFMLLPKCLVFFSVFSFKRISHLKCFSREEKTKISSYVN